MNRNSYQRHRLNRVFGFAQKFVAKQINLDQLASVSCLSKYHFCRTFRDYYGETPLEYLWRIRLELAARRLVFVPQMPIFSVATECGFASPQSFSQAFNRRYHHSPREFRSLSAGNLDEFVKSQNWLNTLPSYGPKEPSREEADLPVRIERRPEMRIAYVRHIGSYGNPDGKLRNVFCQVAKWAVANKLWSANTAGVGVCPDSPTLTPANLCAYDVGITVPPNVQEDNLVSIQTIPTGTYAVLRVRDLNNILHYWKWLASVWLPKTGISYEPFYSYEYYPSGSKYPFCENNGVELCLRTGN